MYQEQARNLVVNFFIVWQFRTCLDKQHKLLGRLTEIGTELFVISACALRIDSMIKDEPEKKAEYLELMDVVLTNQRFASKIISKCVITTTKELFFRKKILGGTFKFLE